MIEMNGVPQAQTISVKPKAQAQSEEKSFFDALKGQLVKEKPTATKENDIEQIVQKESPVNATMLQNILALMQADTVISADMNVVDEKQSQGDLTVLLPTQQSGQVFVEMPMLRTSVPVETVDTMQQATVQGEESVLPDAKQAAEIAPQVIKQNASEGNSSELPVVAVTNPVVIEKSDTVFRTPIVPANSSSVNVGKTVAGQQGTAPTVVNDTLTDAQPELIQSAQQNVDPKLVENEVLKPTDEKQTNQLAEPDMLENKPITIVRDTGFVKISDASSKLDVSPQQQIVDNIQVNLKNDKSEFEMQLFPENLGKVSVKMVAENGLITIQLIADNPKTQSLLLSNANEIKSLVQASTGTNTQVVASNQSEVLQHYSQQQADQENHQNQQNNQTEQNQATNENDEAVAIDFTSLLEQMKQSMQYNRFSI